MIFKALQRIFALVATVLACQAPACAEGQSYSFNVLNHRPIAVTAAYWNPILSYVSQKTGVNLDLKLSKTIQENTARAETGTFDFLYTNHFFTPERDRLGYRVIARPAGPGIRGQIVVTEDSPIRTLQDLDGKAVAFSTPDGMAGYWLPMDALLKAGVQAKPVFSGSHHASLVMATRKDVAAVGINDTVLDNFTQRGGARYRVLWTSKVYNDLCIMAHPRVPKEKVDAVKAALAGMLKDPVGRKILEDGAALLQSDDELGFVPSSSRDYDDYRAFFKHTRVKAAG
jgi:phosphonate transport system substrate-binding protein